METRAHFVLIGSLMLAVIAAAFGFVFWFKNLGTAAQRTPLRIVFEGSASGLRTGGNVNFNGIKIGEVTSVKLDDPKKVVVITSVDKAAPIRRDTLVGLEFAGLTGVSAVSLKGGSLEADGVPMAEDGLPTLTADPNAMQDIGDAVRATLQNVNRLVTENQEALRKSISNLENFSNNLSNNSARIDSILIGVETLVGAKDGQDGELQLAAKALRKALADVSRAVNNFDRNPSRLLFGASNSDAPATPAGPRAKVKR